MRINWPIKESYSSSLFPELSVHHDPLVVILLPLETGNFHLSKAEP